MLADHGFTIAESVAAMHAKLHIHAFTKGKSQLSALKVEDARKIASVRIHIKHCYTPDQRSHPGLHFVCSPASQATYEM